MQNQVANRKSEHLELKTLQVLIQQFISCKQGRALSIRAYKTAVTEMQAWLCEPLVTPVALVTFVI